MLVVVSGNRHSVVQVIVTLLLGHFTLRRTLIMSHCHNGLIIYSYRGIFPFQVADSALVFPAAVFPVVIRSADQCYIVPRIVILDKIDSIKETESDKYHFYRINAGV